MTKIPPKKPICIFSVTVIFSLQASVFLVILLPEDLHSYTLDRTAGGIEGLDQNRRVCGLEGQ